MKTEDEIQLAHDKLAAVILHDVNVGLSEEQIKWLSLYCDVLCWMLGHDHNRNFESNLKALDLEFEERGIVDTQRMAS